VGELTGGQIIFLAVLGAWLVIALMGMLLGLRRKEHAHRERLAMIERGLAPPPELYPERYDAPPWAQAPRPHSQGVMRRDYRVPHPRVIARKVGTLIVFGGLGVGWLIFMFGEQTAALGVGGFIVLLGLGFIVTSFNLGLPREMQTPAGLPPTSTPPDASKPES
jgi:hypothetical protein